MLFNFIANEDAYDRLIRENATEQLTDKQFIEREIRRFKISIKRHEMYCGENYYKGKQDILRRKRTAIGDGGKLESVDNLPNNRIVDNQYQKMVDQKNNFLLGNPITVQGDNEEYIKLLQQQYFNAKFCRTLINCGKDLINCGIGWLFPCHNQFGELYFKRIKPYELIPGWKDAEHTELDYMIHIYPVVVYEKNSSEDKVIERVEVCDEGGITYFELTDGGSLIPVAPFHSNYFTITACDGVTTEYNWLKIPFIPFKFNAEEIPLIRRTKSLQDAINTIESNFQNAMEEDVRNTILVLVNYDGTDLGEFRRNLATYGAVKVNTADGGGGDVRTLQIEVKAENYKAILDILKKALIENAMGYDAKDDRLGGNANELNIQSMYSDIDLDANGTEIQLQAALEEMLWFINAHLYNTNVGDFSNETVDFIFNRNVMINESIIIENCQKSQGVISDETIIAKHPWVDDPQKELERIEEEKQKNIEQYSNAFNDNQDDNTNDNSDGDE